jgi:hypothetical protein
MADLAMPATDMQPRIPLWYAMSDIILPTRSTFVITVIMMHQLLGIFVCLVSAGAFIVRYDIPTFGQAIGYLAFGLAFVITGLIVGQMLEASIVELLLLEKWNFNLSLMAIGYSAIASGLVGIYAAVKQITNGDQDQEPGT